MEEITSVPGKLLYLAHKLALEKQISARDKGILKDLILDDNKQLKILYDKYLKEGTELTLASDLLHLLHIRPHDDNETEQASSQGSKKPKRGHITISIPKRNIQKLPNIENRI